MKPLRFPRHGQEPAPAGNLQAVGPDVGSERGLSLLLQTAKELPQPQV